MREKIGLIKCCIFMSALCLIFLIPAPGIATTQASGVTVTMDPQTILSPIRAEIFGNNIAWNEDGPAMTESRNEYLALADRLSPTALRFPGGTLSDLYHWRDGIGPVEFRKPGRTLSGDTAAMTFGTDEFLDLCKRWDATPLITVNIATGTAQDAADWVRYTNKRVVHWEIGNEPYLPPHSPDLAISAEDFARRASAFIRAMRAADPGIKVGIPLRSDILVNRTDKTYARFNETVLRSITEPFDFVSLHGAYFPVSLNGGYTKDDLFMATMAGVESLRADLDSTRALLQRYHPGRDIQVAVTELNTLYSADILRWGLASLILSKTDGYIQSHASALYVADALLLLSERTDILMANYWSMGRNWWFGAIGHDGKPRPQFYALESLRNAIPGTRRIRVNINTPTLSTPDIGYSIGQKSLPALHPGAFITRDGKIRLVIINRDPAQTHMIKTAWADGKNRKIQTARTLTARTPFSKDSQWSDLKKEAGLIPLPPASLNIIEWE